MRRAVERHLEDPMAEELLKGTIKGGDKVLVSCVDSKMTFAVTESTAETAPAGTPTEESNPDAT
jgi:ATP-dependent Clp protease ATP-binding subunit ClpC